MSEQVAGLQAYPLIDRILQTRAGGDKTVRQRTALYVEVAQESPEDPAKTVYVIGEALCHLDDNFNKSKGLAIAKGRAHKLLKGECDYAKTFTLEQALATVEFEEVGLKISSVCTPQTGAPLPYGLVNRLKQLVSYEVPAELYADWNLQSK
jgi:hypothetical protein